MENPEEVVEETPDSPGDPTIVTSQDNVRISRRLQIKRDNKKKKKPVKISLQVLISIKNFQFKLLVLEAIL